MEITINTDGTNQVTYCAFFGSDTNGLPNPERVVNINFGYESN